MKTLESLLKEDVSDPTDFATASQAPGLRSLDASLRCPICGDLFDAPVTIPCGHCFCSKCVRPPLGLKAECPQCRKPANDVQLRPVLALEDAVTSWNESRAFILQLLSERDQWLSQNQNTQVNGEAHSKNKKRKRSASIEILDSCVPGPSSSPRFSSRSHSQSRTTSQPASNDSSDIARDAMVECPICCKKVQFQKLNPHIDGGCKSDAPSQWSNLLGSSAKSVQHSKGKQKKKASDEDDDYPLPKVSYDALKDKALREILSEQGLPTTGDRSLLQQRHERWVVLYNANLDRSKAKRQTKGDLRKELKKWEDETLKRKKHTVSDPVEYQRTHREDFAKLVAAARESKDKNVNEGTHSSTNTTSVPSSSLAHPETSPNATGGTLASSGEQEQEPMDLGSGE